MMTPYEIERCNALGRALPKAWRKIIGETRGGPKADSPAWHEQYHIHQSATQVWHELRRRLNEEVTPWFDNSAFASRDDILRDSK